MAESESGSNPFEISSGDFDLDFDLDLLFDSVPVDLALDEIPANGNPPEDPVASWVNDLEKFLLEEGGEREEVVEDPNGFPEEFFADFFADASDDGSAKSVVSRGDANTPESGVEEKIEGSDGKSGGEEEISRKKIRQMRNRDSAMKSRERRKMYVKDLEMKSKYLEAECKRLEHVVRCFAAENIALRHRMQNDRTSGVSQAKQESAVLIMESLLLGSLFWLMITVFLFLAPGLSAWNVLVEAIEKARGLQEIRNQVTVGTRRSRSERRSVDLGSESIFMGRRCKALKPKMRNLIASCT